MKKLNRILMGFVFVSSASFAASNYFYQGAAEDCDTSCSIAASNAQDRATQEAASVCYPALVKQVSPWNIRVQNYGRIHVAAAFVCE